MEQGICSIRHATTCRCIHKDKKAAGNLHRYMRIMPKKRWKRCNSKDSRGVLRGKRHISERPAEVELRQQPGHWEGDTVIGVDTRFSSLPLVERRSGFAIIKKLKAHPTLAVNAAAIQAIMALDSMIAGSLRPDSRSGLLCCAVSFLGADLNARPSRRQGLKIPSELYYASWPSIAHQR
jgi:IS30 family transposase